MADQNENQLTPEQELLKKIKEEVKTELQGFATSQSLEEIKSKLDNMAETIKSSEEFKTLTKGLEEATLRIAALSEKGGSDQPSEGELVKFIQRESLKEAFENKKQGMESMAVKAAALMTTGNVLPNVANGFNQLFGNYVDTTIHSVPKPENFILPLVTVETAAGTENIWYVDRINEEGDAQFIGEGDLKPLIDAEWQQYKTDVKEVAERWKMSNRLIMHAPSVVSNFREHADELIENKIDEGVLVGDGTGNNLSGITTLASAFVPPTQLANYYEDANIYDVINAVATSVKLNNFKGQLTAVLNTVWEAKMAGIKNANGDYIVPPFVTPDGTRVGSTRLVFSNRMPDTHILCGDLKKFKTVIAEDIMYFEGWENDDFSKNLSSRKLEAFLGTYLPNSYTGAIVYDDIATILTAIEVVPAP